MTLQELLLDQLPFDRDELTAIIATAPYRYKVFRIPKRTFGQYRVIAQPSVEVKLIQRWLIRHLAGRLPIHSAAMAYRSGVSTRDHAQIHCQSRFLLKMDFSDFFPSITAQDVNQHLLRFGEMSLEDARLATQVVCWLDPDRQVRRLSIGAPSSPLLSNSILYEFDSLIAAAIRGRRIQYSRYADDLAFSTDRPDVLESMRERVISLCQDIQHPKLSVNHQKTVSVSRAQQRRLVGLVLTADGNVSLGRDKKRRLRSALYRFSQGSLDELDVPHLRGELAYAWSAEPIFIERLLRVFGPGVFNRIGLPFGQAMDNPK